MNHPELTQSTAKSRNDVSATASHTQSANKTRNDVSAKKVVETDNITTTAAAEKP